MSTCTNVLLVISSILSYFYVKSFFFHGFFLWYMFVPHMVLINTTMITPLRSYEKFCSYEYLKIKQVKKWGDLHQSSSEPATISAKTYFYVVYKHKSEDQKWAYTSVLQGDDGSNGIRGTPGEKGFKVISVSTVYRATHEISASLYALCIMPYYSHRRDAV